LLTMIRPEKKKQRDDQPKKIILISLSNQQVWSLQKRGFPEDSDDRTTIRTDRQATAATMHDNDQV